MEGPINHLLALFQGSLIRRESVSDILDVNEATAQTGLIFTPQQAVTLLQARDDALSDSGRLELGSGMVKRLILAFSESPFFQNGQAVDILSELMDLFYHLKNETFDLLSDSELLCFLRELYDGECRGSLALLRDAAINRLARVIHGAPQEDKETEDTLEEEADE